MQKTVVDERTGEVFEVLVDCKPNGKVYDWRGKKLKSLELSDIYNDLKITSKRDRIKDCGTYLEYRLLPDESMKLYRANFCKIRLCPLCAWRRSLKIYGQMASIINVVNQGDYSYLFLTLTIKNVKADDLKMTIKKLMKSFNKLTKYKEVSRIAKGWYRALEITYNAKTDSFHPHFHVILCVRKSYFKSRYYVSSARMRELWKRALNIDYLPQVDMRKIRGDTIDDMSKSIAELAKYTVKDSDYIRENDRELSRKLVFILDDALRNVRLIAFGGIFKKIHSDLKLDDAIDGDLIFTDNEENLEEEKLQLISYVWQAGVKQYVKL